MPSLTLSTKIVVTLLFLFTGFLSENKSRNFKTQTVRLKVELIVNGWESNVLFHLGCTPTVEVNGEETHPI